MSALYVRHDEKRMKIVREVMIDDEPGYELQPARRPGGRQPATLFARVSECQPWHSARVRRYRAGGFVLEFGDETGEIKVRQARSPRRYRITLQQLYDYAVRLSVFGKRLPKALRARRKR